MSLPKFFDRAYAAVGRALAVSRESLEEALNSKTLTIVCGEHGMNQNDRWSSELLVNLCARLYPALSIEGSAEDKSRLATIVRAINPDIAIADSVDFPTIKIVFGQARVEGPSLYASADGWVARLDTRPKTSSRGPINVYAAGAAACLAANAIFRAMFTKASLGELIATVSLLDYSQNCGEYLELGDATLGSAALIGLGAVGQAGIWALARHSGLRGSLYLVDDERIETSNLQRYVLTTETSIETQKTDVAALALAATSLEFQKYDMRSDNVPGLSKLATLCVAADTVAARRSAQALLPQLIVNGWTSSSGLGASTHVLGSGEACLACLYHPVGLSKSETEIVAESLGLSHERARQLWAKKAVPTPNDWEVIVQHLEATNGEIDAWRARPITEIYRDVICGSVRLNLGKYGRHEQVPLAHQSALAGVLMAAEWIKRVTPELQGKVQAGKYVVWDDVMARPPRYWTRIPPQPPGCFCKDPVYLEAFREKWATQL